MAKTILMGECIQPILLDEGVFMMSDANFSIDPNMIQKAVGAMASGDMMFALRSPD
ncbi:hypothetical protein [Effusibacillus dendaii]|uniref:Uncharacterized protein n=1 Tax=Effusibacillus dendaii TaxID=2743772 RepID=A0A7I8DEJ5_9BACL|nr:hypothetical protein [Effusibacillus dendaii]BCJ88475.1 hypothetical protein skT53_34600 [Effusibacillus dendaii]